MVCGCASSQPPATAAVALTAQQQAAAARAQQVETQLALGRALSTQHRAADAEQQLRRALQLSWGFGEPWSRYRADGLGELGRALFAQGRTTDARAAVTEALGLLKPGALASDRQISELETTRAESFRYDQQPALAIAPFAAAVTATSRHPAELATAQIALSLRLADTLQRLGERQRATKTLEGVLDMARSQAGATLAERVAQALAPLYEAAGEPRRARELLAAYGGALDSSPSAPSPSANAANASPNSTAKEVVSMQADFRACYRASLADDGDVQGKVELVIQIAADGRVVNVKADGGGLPTNAVNCLLKRASIAQFDPPMGGATVLTVPVTFVKQEND